MFVNSNVKCYLSLELNIKHQKYETKSLDISGTDEELNYQIPELVYSL